MITLDPYVGTNPEGNESDGWDDPITLGDDEIAVEDPDNPGRYMATKIDTKEPDMAELHKSGNIWKDDSRRLVFGWASVAKVDGEVLLDRQGDLIDDEWEMERTAYDFVMNCRVGGDDHVMKGVSTMVESMVFTDEKCDALGLSKSFPRGWFVGFKVTDERTWSLIKSGDYAGFSVHGTGTRTEVDLDEVAWTDIGKSHKLPIAALERFQAVKEQFNAGSAEAVLGKSHHRSAR